MAETEMSAFSRVCLSKTIPDEETLIAELSALEAERNHRRHTVKWQFTTEDARVKLRTLYPSYSG